METSRATAEIVELVIEEEGDVLQQACTDISTGATLTLALLFGDKAERSKGMIFSTAESVGLILDLRRRHSENEPSPDFETSNFDRMRSAKSTKDTTEECTLGSDNNGSSCCRSVSVSGREGAANFGLSRLLVVHFVVAKSV